MCPKGQWEMGVHQVVHDFTVQTVLPGSGVDRDSLDGPSGSMLYPLLKFPKP